MSYHLFGMKQIAAHLGVTRNTVEKWRTRHSLFMYWRQNPATNRLCWYSNTALLLAWEMARARQDIQAARARQAGHAPMVDLDG